MLLIDKEGMVVNPRVHAARATSIERGQMKLVSGIIVHQTGGSTAQSSLSSYKNPLANGAHFLIEKEGTIYQTASLSQQTWHVGKLKARCLLENRCTPVEIKALKTFSPTAENKREMAKQAPARFPANQDSIGIELVGEALANDSYVAVTVAQNDSLKWLVGELSQTLGIAPTEVFRHPDVSRKNPTEASTAAW